MSEQQINSGVLSADQIWNAMSPSERLRGCELFWSHAGEKERARAIIVLAEELRFREKTLLGMGEASRGAHLDKRINHGRLREHRSSVIRSWLIGAQREMLTAFVNQLGVPHKDGLIEGEHPAPPVEAFQRGIEALSPYSPRVAAIYLGFLVIFGDDELWAPLAPALAAEKWDLQAMLRGEYPEPTRPEESQGGPEDNPAFTTLDNALIVAAVASAFGQTGALQPDQIIDLVDEVVELNSSRQHSLFHRGFVDALFKREFRFHFPGENEERRLWYACGAIFGLLRHEDHDRILGILEEHSDLADGLAKRKNVECGAKLLPPIFGLLLDAGKLPLLTDWMDAQIPRLDPGRAFALLANAHYRGAALLRGGRAAEADMLFEVIEDSVSRFPMEAGDKDYDNDNDNDNATALAELFGSNWRKRSQVLQLQGDFGGATKRLEALERLPGVKTLDLANAAADQGLIAGGFRSIAAIMPVSNDAEQRQTIAIALEKGRPRFQEAIDRFGGEAANAHFCLGILGLLTEPGNPQQTADHWRHALAGMLRRQFAYEASGMIDWARFALGVSLLESLEPSEYQHASDSIAHALQAPTKFPIWLWGRTLRAASYFDDRTLLEMTATALLGSRAEEALPLLLDSGAADRNSALRSDVLRMLGDANLPVRTLWDRLVRLLPAALSDGSDEGEQILDRLEGIAVECAELRPEFVRLLSNTRFYSPAWDPVDAETALVRMHLLEGEFDMAKDSLLRRYYRLREERKGYQRVEGLNILEEVRFFPGTDPDDMDQLAASWPADDERELDHASWMTELRAGGKIRVLYVGGNETQQQYVGDLRKLITKEFPGVELEFEMPGWSSNWIVDAERVKAKLQRFDVLVLNNLVRTQFGKHVRKACGPHCPWIGCSGRGKESLRKSIRQAAVFAAERKTSFEKAP